MKCIVLESDFLRWNPKVTSSKEVISAFFFLNCEVGIIIKLISRIHLCRFWIPKVLFLNPALDCLWYNSGKLKAGLYIKQCICHGSLVEKTKMKEQTELWLLTALHCLQRMPDAACFRGWSNTFSHSKVEENKSTLSWPLINSQSQLPSKTSCGLLENPVF